MNPTLIQPDLTKPVAADLYPATLPYSFPLDPFQQHAISAIHQGHHVLVCAKTGSGKTLVGEYQIYHSLAKGERVFYTTPIKSLSNQKYDDLRTQFKDHSVGIMTGDIKFRPDAQIVVMTTEILRNLLYKQGTKTEGLGLSASLRLEGLGAVIFDECHYINDPDRGKVWEETMILLNPSVKLVLLSATLNKPEAFAGWLGSLKQVPVHLIQTSYRIVPLTHAVLGASGTDLLTILTPGTELFQEKTYRDWLAARKALGDAYRAFQDRVHAKVVKGEKGAVADKVRIKSYPHQLNEAIEFLRTSHNLPALFFVFSRKGCEKYAALVERSLLNGAEQASVRHLMDSYLSHHKAALASLPMYHTLRDLMCKGVAFHHSGMLPILKEVVELLFGRGFIKVLFATETFAVGLNMPTKTVVFTSLSKFDEGGQRLLRTDEYTQMAGRAGRRGKDTEGLVLYLPEREAVTVDDLRHILSGGKQAIRSRMDFHYDFLLKTLQSGYSDGRSVWIHLMEKSYWFQQRQLAREAAAKELAATDAVVAAAEATLSPELRDLARQHEILTSNILLVQGRARKHAHTALHEFKETHPTLLPAHLTQYAAYKKLCGIRTDQRQDVLWLQNHARTVEPALGFLRSLEYLTPESASKPPDTLSSTDLTLRGILATEINEGNPILMTELFLSRKAHDLAGPELATVLSAFLEDFDKDLVLTVKYIQVPDTTKAALQSLVDLAKEFQTREDDFYRGPGSNEQVWATTLQWTEPLYWWLTEEVHISTVCAEYGLFEGNFVRGLLKLANILDEWLSLATYCEHADQIEKVTALRSLLVRDLAVPDSLYLKV